MRGILANGRTIRVIRSACAMTQEDLATLAGCDVKTVRSAERGRSVDVKTLRAISAALDVPVAAIAQVNDSPEQTADRVNSTWAWQRALNAREVPAMLQMYHADAEIHFPPFESFNSRTVHRGTRAIRQLFKSVLARVELKPAAPKSFRLHVADEYLFFRGQVQGRIRAAQRPFKVDVFHELRFRGGAAANHIVLFDTAPFADIRGS